MSAKREAVIVGAGISGLACAWRLRQKGVEVRVLEASERAGGVVSSVEQNGCLFESGPQSFQMTAELRELIRGAGCEGEVVEADARMPRYILLGGKLLPAPMSPPQLLTTSLLGMGSKLRLAGEAMHRTHPPADDESFADFVRRKFGTEILEHLAGPFVSGVFAGDPEKLSMRSTFPSMAQWEQEYGSVLRGAMKSRGDGPREKPTLAGFRRGMGSFLAAIAKSLGGVATGARVERVESGGEAGWKIRAEGAGQGDETCSRVLVIATPAYEAARLVSGIAAQLAKTLSAIPYAPVAVVAEGYRREYVGHALNGFGFLVPRKEELRTLGTIWNSSLFPERAPEGAAVLTSFIGGAMDPKVVEEDPGVIANLVRDEIGPVLKISGPPFAREVWRHKRALPQYNLGHSSRVKWIAEELEGTRGLFLAGNYLDGPSMGNCVAQGFHVAEEVEKFLAN